MQDHSFEGYAEMLERETVDELAEWAAFENHRGDDRTEALPRCWGENWTASPVPISPRTPAPAVGSRRRGEQPTIEEKAA